jgi:hypothetical protein
MLLVLLLLMLLDDLGDAPHRSTASAARQSRFLRLSFVFGDS